MNLFLPVSQLVADQEEKNEKEAQWRHLNFYLLGVRTTGFRSEFQAHCGGKKGGR
jgi:hypothetical protein